MKRNITPIVLLLGLLALVVLAGPAAPTARAAQFAVSNLNDSGTGSLRAAIQAANANGVPDTITFDVSGTVILASTLFIFDPNGLTIDGAGQNITISGNNLVRVMSVVSGAELTVKNLTVADGNGGLTGGGGIFNQGTLTVSNSTLAGNSADFGGGIYNAGTVTVSNSTFAENSGTVGSGGGIYNASGRALTVSNSTFTSNSAASRGGGIFNLGTLTVSNSTFAGNSASSTGGGIVNSGGTMTLKNTIVANSTGGNCSGAIVDGGGNLSYPDDGTCPGIHADPQLGPLQVNAPGNTATHALAADSPAVDTALAANCLTIDQRGVTRPQGDACDIGAFELEQVSNSPPVCEQARPSQSSLWPPNHNFVSIDVLDVTDPDGDTVTITIDSIQQDEPVDSIDEDGEQTTPDGRGVDTSTAEVRAERDESGDGRVYHIGFIADDGHSGSCSGEVLVGVPLSKKATAADGGPLYDSTAE